MDQRFLRKIADQLQHERRALIDEINEADEVFYTMNETKQEGITYEPPTSPLAPPNRKED